MEIALHDEPKSNYLQLKLNSSTVITITHVSIIWDVNVTDEEEYVFGTSAVCPPPPTNFFIFKQFRGLKLSTFFLCSKFESDLQYLQYFWNSFWRGGGDLIRST
jgi:hypothetical protein